MLLNTLLWLIAGAVTGGIYLLVPSLSPWWIVPLWIAGYFSVAILYILGALAASYTVRHAGNTPYRRFIYWMISQSAEWVSLLCGVRVRLTGHQLLPTDTPFLLVSNHLSNLDPIITIALFRHRELAFISKPENFKLPVVAPIIRNLSFLAIDRENPRNAVATIKTAAQQITERRLNMAIYPEGTRNKTGEGTLPFHNGSFKIASVAKCPVVVCALRYEAATFPFKRTAQLQVVDVMDTAYVTAHRTDALSERAQQSIANFING